MLFLYHGIGYSLHVRRDVSCGPIALSRPLIVCRQRLVTRVLNQTHREKNVIKIFNQKRDLAGATRQIEAARKNRLVEFQVQVSDRKSAPRWSSAVTFESCARADQKEPYKERRVSSYRFLRSYWLLEHREPGSPTRNLGPGDTKGNDRAYDGRVRAQSRTRPGSRQVHRP